MVQVLQSQLKDAPLTTHNHLLAGALAGGVAATCTIPFDVGMLARSSRYHRRRCGRCRWLTPSSIALRPVKTRLQTQATLPKNEQRYTGVLQAFRTIYNEEGTHARLNECMHDRVSKRSNQQQYSPVGSRACDRSNWVYARSCATHNVLDAGGFVDVRVLRGLQEVTPVFVHECVREEYEQ